MSSRPFLAAVCAIALVCATACARQDVRLQQHAERFDSLAATTKVVVEAWLSGYLSGTYTRTALEQTFLLVEKERSTLASAPRFLSDPRGARLSASADRLARVLALLIDDVRAANAPSSRKHLALVIGPPELE